MIWAEKGLGGCELTAAGRVSTIHSVQVFLTVIHMEERDSQDSIADLLEDSDRGGSAVQLIPLGSPPDSSGYF